MEKLTAWEFEKHCKEKKYTRFCLTSEDQKLKFDGGIDP